MKIQDSLTVISLFIVAVLVVVAGFVFKKPLEGPPGYYINIEKAKSLIDTNPELVIIDLSKYFYDDGHIPGAINYTRCALARSINTFDKNKPYLVYCHAFGAPRTSAQMLLAAGFKNVYALRGNFGAWVDAGYEIEN